MPGKVLQQTYSTRFGDFALESYSFVADNYAPFYSTPIECTDRDAGFVLDGILYNESDLDLEEHYTDTHGYTEINFAAFAMLGRRFCPRIRGVGKQRLYRLDARRDYGPLAGLVSRADRTIDPQGDRRAVGPDGAVLRVSGERSYDRLGRAETSCFMHRQEPILPGQSRSGPDLQVRVPARLPVRAAVAIADPQGVAEGRATARAGPGRVLRATGADQRPRAARADELV
jgi:hypothetical protein